MIFINRLSDCEQLCETMFALNDIIIFVLKVYKLLKWVTIFLPISRGESEKGLKGI